MVIPFAKQILLRDTTTTAAGPSSTHSQAGGVRSEKSTSDRVDSASIHCSTGEKSERTTGDSVKSSSARCVTDEKSERTTSQSDENDSSTKFKVLFKHCSNTFILVNLIILGNATSST